MNESEKQQSGLPNRQKKELADYVKIASGEECRELLRLRKRELIDRTRKELTPNSQELLRLRKRELIN
jgi:hypothetical protein